MKVVYVAGKFRGPNHWAIHENIRAAERVAHEVWKLGAVALCPHLNTIHFQDSLPDHIWLDGDLEMLARCDAVLTVDNWTDSAGAKAEVDHANALRIPVFHQAEQLATWLTCTHGCGKHVYPVGRPCMKCGTLVSATPSAKP